MTVWVGAKLSSGWMDRGVGYLGYEARGNFGFLHCAALRSE